MKILLTGSTGFIGANLKEQLRGHYNLYTPSRKTLNLLDSEKVSQYLDENKFDIVIHTANTNNIKESLTPYEVLNNGLRMFYNLEKNNCLYGKMIYLGSGAEYDSQYYTPKMEEDYFGKYIPKDPYGFAKYTMSRIARKSQNIYDLRLFGVYGKYEEWQRRFISNNIVRSLKGLPMTLSQNAMFDYLYVDDLCRIIEWFIEHEPKHKHYNVCTGQPIDLLSLAGMINEVSGFDREILIAKEGWQPEYSGDNSRLLAEIGEFSFTDKKTSIQEMWNYYSAHIDELDERQLLL